MQLKYGPKIQELVDVSSQTDLIYRKVCLVFYDELNRSDTAKYVRDNSLQNLKKFHCFMTES
jgi:hypothetical protein